jgi:hypothetical protein
VRAEPDEQPEPLLGGLVSSHPMAVDAQREAGAGVSKLVHDAARIDADRDECTLR